MVTSTAMAQFFSAVSEIRSGKVRPHMSAASAVAAVRGQEVGNERNEGKRAGVTPRT